MLVSMKTVLDPADAKKVAVGAFNIISLEGIQAVLGAAEELGQPVIPQFASVHESIIPLKVIGPAMVMTAEKSSVFICVHLDHGNKLEILREALEMGLTSAMYDGSVLPFEKNAANTRIAAEMAGDWGTSVEAEIGAMGRQKFSSVGESEKGEAVENCYTDPEQARAFTELTGADALACSFDTMCGLYLTAPKLDFDRMRRIRESIGIPVVMHGGPGVSDENFKKCIANGVRKINYYTYPAKAGGMYVKERCRAAEEYVFFHDVTQWAVQAMKEDVLHTTRVLSHLE